MSAKGERPKLGATVTAAGVDFAVYSETAERIWVCLFDGGDREVSRIELARGEGAVWEGHADGLAPGARYGLRADGRYDPAQAYHFDPNKLLVDPYARRIDRGFVRRPELSAARGESVDTAAFVPKALVEGPAPALYAPPEGGRPRLVYELNVRPYTMLHPGVAAPLRGTLAGLMAPEVIAHIQRLGVDVIELLPVAAWIDDAHLPALGLTNVWGYNPITYFAPDPRLAPGGPEELRQLVAAYGEVGIRVVLDVVYNHTGEGDAEGPILSMKGLDARTYYRHSEVDGRLVLVNDAGTGNTLQCDHPAVQDLVIDSLRHWVDAFGIAGFRFDLAPILGRSTKGFSSQAELLARIREDAVLGRCLLVAEPWDPGPGGYHVGRFGEPFIEWNDRYRDDVRRFWRGDAHMIGALADRLAGSADLFNHDGRRPSASVNFLAAHDGFTLADLVAHERKHNAANGEDNHDGHDANHSWNCGVEGRTDDAEIVRRRGDDVRALLATLFVSHGTPMLTAGDELGRSQGGNNNAYAQDNAVTWLDWAGADGELAGFVASLSALRRGHPGFRSDRFLSGVERAGWKDVAWLRPDGTEMTQADWQAPDASVLGMLLHEAGETLLVWFNRVRERVEVRLSAEPGVAFDVALVSCRDAEVIAGPHSLVLPPRSVVILAPAKG
ncbi:glycogen debranching protein GlgX [Pelagibacterium lacus]|uniref:Glycogen debranching enzyme GlgX n=1 Tax=Pelagibacterium lacus TaxID=2282655 RepID=A0A369W766_9HYPH|nr:glycogen debranching protein GlgX [Pelagibacterium lacus]RDE10173.1 glycogen debranching enzyme GlgX [Pelagibacterium lacus]